ncbi:translation initiation factor IF-2 [Entomospira nematocerorum]|uniref:Translation initiation factor IF-2 n=1 Tax=Entomospira nematocerorum TaxID=2719987 RepID=A0A968GC51_9SPIO|nr:translation initiation factor IF-2 [Entomospira nematocera]NIZ46703.1 translation initiation factor IF-2 [Entomospira nematocera]WDI33501.1 translation initiation factor IF-2 [Entomospira nematocera]
MTSESEKDKKEEAPLIKKDKRKQETESKIDAPSTKEDMQVATTNTGNKDAKKKRIVVVSKKPTEYSKSHKNTNSQSTTTPTQAASSSSGKPSSPSSSSIQSLDRPRVHKKAGNLAGGSNHTTSTYSSPTGRTSPSYGSGNRTTTINSSSSYGSRSTTTQRYEQTSSYANHTNSHAPSYRSRHEGGSDRPQRPHSGGGQQYPRSSHPQGNNSRPPYRPHGGHNSSGAGAGGRTPGQKPAMVAETIDLTRSAGAAKWAASRGKKNYQGKGQSQSDSEKFFQQKRKIINTTQAVPSTIDIMESITVSDLAKKMNLKASDLITKLMSLGVMVTINGQIDSDTATILAEEYKCKVNVVSLYDETVIETEKDNPEDLVTRNPIVTIMGHVDHGKTKTLDAIRSADVVSREAGGITQHIGAYQVTLPSGQQITFLDTPGHEAFSAMRERGASVTDIVVLVVSGVEGVMPQTREAIKQAKEAAAPIIVAVNKMDLPDASMERIQQQLSEFELIPESWGGSTIFAPISALTGSGINELLEVILLQAEMMELTTNPKCAAEGHVIEARIDPGRGIAATVLLSRGTLHVGDPFVAGIFYGKIRAMYNDKGQRIKEAYPAQPVEITGFSEGTPKAGDPFQVTKDEAMARQVASKRQELNKLEEAKNVKKISLANFMENLSTKEQKELRLIIKGDVQGSVEALKQSLEKLSNNEIRLTVLSATAGAIVEQDVKSAATSDAIIIGFHVRPTPKAQLLADQEKVEIRKYNLIYEVIEDITLAIEGLLTPELREQVTGQAEIRKVFASSKVGNIAGCMIISGVITRKSRIHVIRDSVVMGDCTIAGLKREKDDVKEVREGFECGITLQGYSDIKMGDILEAYDIHEIKRRLNSSK